MFKVGIHLLDHVLDDGGFHRRRFGILRRDGAVAALRNPESRAAKQMRRARVIHLIPQVGDHAVIVAG